jgi:hypothetical protein
MKSFKEFLLESNVSAKDLFDNSAITRNKSIQYKGRTKLIEMRIDRFLDLTEKLDTPEEQKIHNIKEIIKKGIKFSDLSFLKTETEGSIAQVIGHEGRHRAIVLKELGYITMPVVISDSNIRWSEQEDSTSYDYKKDFPTKIKSENGSPMYPFPFKRETVNSTYTGTI